MWLYVIYAAVFLHLTKAISEKRYNTHEEAIFADVIRNISRVNNALHELITNYELLQKIYKSQEASDDYSSDAEIDEVFKSIQKAHKYHKKKAEFNPTDKPTNVASFPATQMIWSEDKDDDREEDYIDNTSKMKNQKEIFSKTQAKDISLKYDTVENKSSESMEKIITTSYSKPREAKIIFIDTHKKMEEINENKNISSFNMINATKKPKTRYKKVSKNSKVNMKAAKKKPRFFLREDKITGGAKMLVYAENFSPKSIWKEIIKNKPINLVPQNNYNSPQKIAVNKPKQSLRSESKKLPSAIHSKKKSKGIKPKEKDPFESPEDDTIAKEMFKTNVLRHAYGDACMKVVVKKCYKGCKQAGNSFCTLYKCKSAFKYKFKELSKTGCLREFIGVKSNKSDVRYGGQDDVIIDATKDRFLDAACLPHTDMRHKTQILRNATIQRSITKQDKSINILRDKYERACRKVSLDKCTSACNFAYTNTCDSFKCDNNKRRKFKNFCKQQCKVQYIVYSDSESSDSDTASSDTSIS